MLVILVEFPFAVKEKQPGIQGGKRMERAGDWPDKETLWHEFEWDRAGGGGATRGEALSLPPGKFDLDLSIRTRVNGNQCRAGQCPPRPAIAAKVDFPKAPATVVT